MTTTRTSSLLLGIALLWVAGCVTEPPRDATSEWEARRAEALETKLNLGEGWRARVLAERRWSWIRVSCLCSPIGEVSAVDDAENIVLAEFYGVGCIHQGTPLEVTRGSEYVGMMVVDTIGDDWAAGHMSILVSNGMPRVGDRVTVVH